MPKPGEQTQGTAATNGLSRRGFLTASVSGGLLMAFGVTPGLSAREALATKQFAPTIWFEMDTQGKTLINIAKAEMGQHVGTALARVVADELGVDFNDVSIKHVDTDPKWGYMITGGSWSVFTSFKQLSQAGAAGRAVLRDAGAKLLGVDAANCEVGGSQVVAGSKNISFADIVSKGDINRSFSAEELEQLPLQDPSERTIIGTDGKALDIPEKSRGEAVYGIDVELEGMVYGRPVIPPTRYGSKIKRVSDKQAKKIPGYQGHVVIDDPSNTLQGWVVALADSHWGAVKAADAISVDWQGGPTNRIAESDLLEAGRKLADDKYSGSLLVDDGDTMKALETSRHKHRATYTTSSVLHFPMEPANALAHFDDGKWHVHSGNQWQSLILPVLAKALGVAETDIIIHQYYLGGGFGRRLYGDYMLPALLASKAVKKPVKLVFTREDDSRFDCVRSPSVQKFDAALNDDGIVTALEHAAVAGWPTLTMAPGFLLDGKEWPKRKSKDKGKIDPFSIAGADHWYTLPNHRVRAVNNGLAQQTFLPGWLRAVGPGWTTWGVEGFIDELAARAKQDPIDFRLGLLDASGKNAGKAPESVGGASRLAEVLRRVKAQSGWGRALPKNHGMGVAIGSGQERTMPTWVACVAHVAVDRKSGQVSIRKIYMVIDCGSVIHPDGAMAQAEGAALWGVSLALHEGSEFQEGQIKARNLDGYSPLRMADVPELDIRFVESQEFPVGLGEPPMSVVAPAIANAIYQAIGVRVRDLPIKPSVLQA